MIVRRGLLIFLSILITLASFASSRAAPVEQTAAFPLVVTVLKPANVRAGPGTDYAIISGAQPGQRLSVIDCNLDCSWYKLAEDCWIAAFLVRPEQPISVSVSGPVPNREGMPTVVVSIPITSPGALFQPTRCPQTNAVVNTYAGPGAFYAVVDARPAGECVAVVGRNAAGDWLQLSHGMWIAASAVSYAEPLATLPNSEPTATPTPTPLPTNTPLPGSQPPTPTPQMFTAPSGSSATSSGNSQPFTCTGGCTVAPNSSCSIKGNADTGIYHTQSSRYYDRTTVDPADGDRWFCTEEEARAAGLRPPEN